MSRRKVVTSKNGLPSSSDPVSGNADGSVDEGSGEVDGDALKSQWRELLTDVCGMILGTHEADPHRFAKRRGDSLKKNFGFALGALIAVGAAAAILGSSSGW